jgi:hypothetical protein
MVRYLRTPLVVALLPMMMTPGSVSKISAAVLREILSWSATSGIVKTASVIAHPVGLFAACACISALSGSVARRVS